GEISRYRLTNGGRQTVAGSSRCWQTGSNKKVHREGASYSLTSHHLGWQVNSAPAIVRHGRCRLRSQCHGDRRSGKQRHWWIGGNSRPWQPTSEILRRIVLCKREGRSVGRREHRLSACRQTEQHAGEIDTLSGGCRIIAAAAGRTAGCGLPA
ncbi:MAG TPA: hypothetical protein PKY22_00775, partial [Accumulibacter sp.]|nr:hypothetical protein [Accumulibacter sp.]